MVPLRFVLCVTEPCTNCELHEFVIHVSTAVYSSVAEALADYKEQLAQGAISEGHLSHRVCVVPANNVCDCISTDPQPADDMETIFGAMRELRVNEQPATRFSWRMYKRASCGLSGHSLLLETSEERTFSSMHECLMDCQFMSWMNLSEWHVTLLIEAGLEKEET